MCEIHTFSCFFISNSTPRLSAPCPCPMVDLLHGEDVANSRTHVQRRHPRCWRRCNWWPERCDGAACRILNVAFGAPTPSMMEWREEGPVWDAVRSVRRVVDEHHLATEERKNRASLRLDQQQAIRAGRPAPEFPYFVWVPWGLTKPGCERCSLVSSAATGPRQGEPRRWCPCPGGPQAPPPGLAETASPRARGARSASSAS